MSKRRKGRVLLVALVVVAFALVTVDFRSGGGDAGSGPLDRVRNVVTAVVRPIQDGVATLVRPLGEAVGGVTDIFSVRSENARLRAQVDTLQERFTSAQDLERENAELRQLLDLRDRAELETVTGSVIALGANNFEWTVTLDVGTADGVARDMPVINGDGLVGRVLQTTTNASVVLLTIDPNFAVSSRTATGGEIGTVSGRGGEPLAFSPFDPDIDLEVGQELVTSRYDAGLYPTGIPIGTIAEVGDPSTTLVREVTVRPFVDFTRLHEVLIVVNAAVEPLPPFEDSDDLGFVRPDVPTFVDPEVIDEESVDDEDEEGGPDPELEGEGSGNGP